CHSMPSHAGTSNAIGYDIILGDRFGASASGLHVDVLESLFADAGFRVGRNAPFAGAYIAQRYGQPAQGRHVIQIEINRGLYLDEHMLKVSAGFEKLRAALSGIMAQFIQHASPSVGLAAE
ncbi:MAG: N-formylglutamate amidohydrolase, partial [Pseudomonadota bacterium]